MGFHSPPSHANVTRCGSPNHCGVGGSPSQPIIFKVVNTKGLGESGKWSPPLLIAAVACGRGDSIIHASVGFNTIL